MLIVLAIGSVIFTCAGGLVVRSNTMHLIEMRDWVEHSHSVLTNLQVTAQRLDRIDYAMQLYQTTGDRDDLASAESAESAESAATLLRVGETSLRNLVQDNPSQTRHAQELEDDLG